MLMQAPNYSEPHAVVEREPGDGFGATSLSSSPMGDGTPRSSRARKEVNYREPELREFDRIDAAEDWDGDLSEWGGLPPQPVEHAGKRVRHLDVAEIIEERNWREARRIALDGGSAATVHHRMHPNYNVRVQPLSNYNGPVTDLPALQTELAFGDGFGGHLARYPVLAAAPHPARHDLREPLSQRTLMLGGISSGVIVRGEVTEVHQGGASVRMNFFLNGRLFEGVLGAQQPLAKSPAAHQPTGQASVTVKVVADAKGQRRPAVTLTASHQPGAGGPASFVPGNPAFIATSPAAPFSPQAAPAFIGPAGGYSLPPGSFVTSAAGYPATCFIAPAVCFAPQGGAAGGVGGGGFVSAPGGYLSAGGGGGMQQQAMMAMAAAAEGGGHDGGEALHEADPAQAQGEGSDRYVS